MAFVSSLHSASNSLSDKPRGHPQPKQIPIKVNIRTNFNVV